MKVRSGKMQGVLLIEPDFHEDSRGFFMESYNYEEFSQKGANYTFIQDNHSLSTQAGVLRGLHYQLEPMSQTKLVRVCTGAIYDVIVDLRKGSLTYGQWESFILSEENKRQLLVPKGFAHGFCTIVSNTQVLYKVDQYYSREHDRGILWNDPELSIDWPMSSPTMSDKDKQHPLLKNAELNFIMQ